MNAKCAPKYFLITFILLSVLLASVACTARNGNIGLLPPETSPLSRELIGFGVVSVLYTRLNSEPSSESAASGQTRIGEIVRVLERRILREDDGSESWLLVEGDSSGWIREEMVGMYENEAQARAAAQAMR
jgi:hypothetical protein